MDINITAKAIIMTVIATLIMMVPFVWYSLFKVYIHRQEIFIKTRHSKLLLTVLCLLAFDITILEPFWFIAIENETMKSIKTVLTAIYSNYQFVTFALIYFRLYLMYYDHKYAMKVRDIKWENMFNSNHHSFFTKHRNTLGSSKWLKKPLIFISTLYITLNIFSFIINDYSLHEILEALYIFLCGILSLYISVHIKSHDDSFYLKQECQYTAIIALVGLLLFITLHFIGYIYNDNIIIHLLSICIFITALFAIFCISSVYVLKKNGYYIFKLTDDKNENYDNEKNINFSIHSKSSHPAYPSYPENPDFASDVDGESDITATTTATHLALDDESSVPLEWMDIVTRKSGFVLFMNHLISEYSHENLIFISEVIQWKLWYERKLNHQIMPETSLIFGYELKLPSNIPISSILTLEISDTENEEFVRAKMIFNKYIKRDKALYEVNINDTQRCILSTYFDIHNDNNYNPDNLWCNKVKLLTIYDEALVDVAWLLKDGFTRFRFTEQFNRYWRRKRNITLSDRIGALFSNSNSNSNKNNTFHFNEAPTN